MGIALWSYLAPSHALLIAPFQNFQMRSAIQNPCVQHDLLLLPPMPARSGPVVALAKAKTSKSSGGSGFGAVVKGAGTKSSGAPSASELLKRSMELYEKIKQEKGRVEELEGEQSADDAENNEEPESRPTFTEYTLSLRLEQGLSGEAADSFSDWVPVALLQLKCAAAGDPIALVPQVVGACCREVLECGCQALPALRKAPRSAVQYSYEPFDPWNTHVYEGLFHRAEQVSEAVKVLGIDKGATSAEVKKAHRKLMMELHPDRFVDDATGAAAAQEQMLQVQKAYEQLGGGVGGASESQYASVGGKARVDFSGPILRDALGPLGKEREAQTMALELGGWRAGVHPMTPEVTKEFITRNIMSPR